MEEKSKELPPAYPADGNCSHTDTLPPPYADSTTPQVQPVAVPQQPELNTWAYELFYCFNDIPTCLIEICLPCAAEYLTARKANMKQLGILLAGVTVSLLCLNFMLWVIVDVLVTKEANEMDRYPDYQNDEDQRIDLTWYYFSMKMLAGTVSTLGIARWLLGLYLRIKLRRRYNIGKPGEPWNDLQDAVCVCFCYDCALCQEMSTVNKIERERSTPIYNPEPMAHA